MRKLIKDEWDKDYNCWSGSGMIYYPEEVEDNWSGHSYYYSNPDNGTKYSAEAARRYLSGEDNVDNRAGGGSDNWRIVSSITRKIAKRT